MQTETGYPREKSVGLNRGIMCLAWVTRALPRSRLGVKQSLFQGVGELDSCGRGWYGLVWDTPNSGILAF